MNKSELENVNDQLMETNNALSVLAGNLDNTRKESERRVLQRTRTLCCLRSRPTAEIFEENWISTSPTMH